MPPCARQDDAALQHFKISGYEQNVLEIVGLPGQQADAMSPDLELAAPLADLATPR